MTGAQLLYCYDQGWGMYDVDFLKLVGKVIAKQRGISVEQGTTIAIWRMSLIDRYGKIKLNLTIKPPTKRYVLIATETLHRRED